MIEIRKAGEKDFEIYCKLYLDEEKEYAKIIGEKPRKISKKEIKSEFERLIKLKNNLIYLAISESGIIGLIYGVVHSVYTPTGFIDNLFVKKEFRNQGVGKMLIKEFMNELKKRKIGICRLGVNLNNEKAIKLYESLGFKAFKQEMKKVVK